MRLSVFALILGLALASCTTVQQAPIGPPATAGVAFDANGELASFADGIVDPQSGRRVTVDDPVRVASIARTVELDMNVKPPKDDLHGRRPACPVFVKEGEPCDLSRWRLGENGSLFAPQVGLRISMRGLARVGRMLLNGGTLDSVRILSAQSVETMLTQVWRFDGSNGVTDGGFYCSYGHATQQIPTPVPGCADDMGTRV